MAVKYFYVKSGGSLGVNDTTPFGAEQADSFANIGAANYYDSVAAACSDGSKGAGNTASDGDFVLVSDAHTKAHDFGFAPKVNDSGAIDGIGLQIISVDNTDSSVYSPGADEALNDGADEWLLSNNGLIAGVALTASDEGIKINDANGKWSIQDVTLSVDSQGGDSCFKNIADGTKITFSNVIFAFTGALTHLGAVSGGGHVTINGGSISGTLPTYLFATSFANGGGRIVFNGLDLSNYSGQIMHTYSAESADTCLVRLNNCELGDSTTLHAGLTSQNHRFEMFNTDDSSDAQHRFHVADGTGLAVNNDTTYVTATEAWYGGSDKSSIQVDTTALCSRAVPFVFTLPAQYVDLSSGSSDKITIEMTTLETLVKSDMAAFLIYPDGTTKAQGNFVSSGPSLSGEWTQNPMDALQGTPTAMPTGAYTASDWEELGGSPNYYKLDLDTSGDAGSATAVAIRIECYTDFTNPVFIHPLLILS